MTCFGDETFGPVISLYRFHDEADAISRANAGEYGLNASIYSRDTRRARAIARQVKCGTVNINEAFGATFASIDSPMGGMRELGHGPPAGQRGDPALHRVAVGRGAEADPVRADVRHEGRDLREADDRQRPPDEEAGTRMMTPDAATSTTTSSSSGRGSGDRSARCGWSRRATGSRVIEAGARFEDDDFAKTSFDLKKFLFRPEIGCYGIQRIDAVRDSLILAGAGVGGGSLVYANTLYEPLEAFYKDAQWRDITDWKAELAPYYDQAKRMLGVVENPLRTPSDDVMEKVANDLGVGDTFHPTPVGVFFGGPESPKGEHVADPYFGGAGPDRNTCIACGDCMTGCKYNAKNTLVKNYLYLAEQRGAKVMPLTTVTRVRPGAAGGYDVTMKFTKAKRATARLHPDHHGRAGRLRGRCDRHPEAAAPDEGRGPPAEALGPPGLPLAHQLRVDPRRHRPGPHGRLQLRDRDHLLVPPRRGHPRRAGALRQGQQRDGDAADRAHRRRRPRAALATWLKEMWNERKNVANLYDLKHWSERTVVALVMQTLDNSITTYPKRIPGTKKWRLTSRQGHGQPNPTWIPIANKVVRKMAAVMGGTAGGSIGEPFNMPMTAHFIGGCAIGTSPENGVVDPYQRVYGYAGLHVADGSAISANLGVNPSLTITAQAERAMSFWPNKGEADPRPALGRGVRARSRRSPPNHPAVPESAPGALRLPIVSVS